MDRMNEDTLLLIFRAYLEEASTMPISLTPVCRQWYNLIDANPTFWSRIFINVKVGVTIPSILAPTCIGFRGYLSRTDGRDLPLDIEIRSHALIKEDHDSTCALQRGRAVCLSTHCSIVNKRQVELNDLFTLLASVESIHQRHEGSGGVPPAARPKRIDRWRSLLIESNQPLEAYAFRRSVLNNVGRTENWMQNPSHIAPRLRHLTLRMVPTDSIPHKDFAPNLTSLTLEDIPGEVGHSIINTSSMTSFSLQRDFPFPIHWAKLSGVCPVEELSLGELTSCRRATINVDFPNLKILKLREDVCRSMVAHIAKQLSNSGRRLDTLHLVNVRLWMVKSYFKEVRGSNLANTQKIIFEILPYFNSDGEREVDPDIDELSTHDIQTFFEEHAPGSEIVVIHKVIPT